MKNHNENKDTLPGLRPSLVIALLVLILLLHLLHSIDDTTATMLF
jgi:hypothetical protein